MEIKLAPLDTSENAPEDSQEFPPRGRQSLYSTLVSLPRAPRATCVGRFPLGFANLLVMNASVWFFLPTLIFSALGLNRRSIQNPLISFPLRILGVFQQLFFDEQRSLIINVIPPFGPNISNLLQSDNCHNIWCNFSCWSWEYPPLVSGGHCWQYPLHHDSLCR